MRPRHWLYTIPLRIRSLFQRRAADNGLDEELQFHLDQKTREFTSKGFSEKEARYAALREFRGVEQSKENCRDARKVNLLLDFAQDPAFRRAHDSQESGLFGNRHSYTRSRHRRERGDLQRRQRGAFAAASLSLAGPDCFDPWRSSNVVRTSS